MSFNAAPALAEQIAEHLEELIITGKLKPKERIQESKVTNSLNVSRGSVREALLILEQRHLIELIPRKGAVVTELNEQDINGLYDMLVVLYTLLAERAVQSWKNKKDLKVFENHLVEMETAANQEDAFEVLNLIFRFIDAGCDLVQNVFLSEALQNLHPTFRRAFYQGLCAAPTELDTITEVLRQILACIKERDVEPLKLVVKEYGEHQRDLALSVFNSVSS